ncbi:hypothetical protein HNY73_019513 [Argiope bruennichi]|uniref:Uncharacterized protein n=1 Tax=Argiope bruennichi TaxID=94029 RepID=A0A8T0E7K2_ARGBR|nr:hypothetical protein HNY73_019513 [Argiope bruennichi]
MIGTALALRERNEILKKEKELNKEAERSLKWKGSEEKGNSDGRNKGELHQIDSTRLHLFIMSGKEVHEPSFFCVPPLTFLISIPIERSLLLIISTGRKCWPANSSVGINRMEFCTKYGRS